MKTLTPDPDKYFSETIKRGNRHVIISANTGAGPFGSRLYVNCDDESAGREPSLGPAAKAKSLAGARKQAERLLSGWGGNR